MKLQTYFPNFRGVLFREVREEKTKGGIYIPEADFVVRTSADLFDNEKVHRADSRIGDYVVIKVGKDCTETEVGDIIILLEGIRPQVISLEDGNYLQVPEQQVIGHSRKE